MAAVMERPTVVGWPSLPTRRRRCQDAGLADAADGGEAARSPNSRKASRISSGRRTASGWPSSRGTRSARTGTPKPKNPPPIVISRYQFKEDVTGYLTDAAEASLCRRIATREGELLTPGDHDEQLPAWSPDGRTIAYVTKRGDDPDRHLNYDIYLIAPEAGATERQLTSFTGSDLDPYWESRPSWSPDGKRIAYLQSGEDKWIYYAPWQLAVDRCRQRQVDAAGPDRPLLLPSRAGRPTARVGVEPGRAGTA